MLYGFALAGAMMLVVGGTTSIASNAGVRSP
jgi:hypothetical protein